MKSRWVAASKFETLPVICPAPLIENAPAPKPLHSMHAAGSVVMAPFDQYAASSQQLPSKTESATCPFAFRLAVSMPA